jgi:hypothetical protein
VFFFDVFVLFFAYEQFTLLRFVIVQHRLSLEELDVHKSRFNRQERSIARGARCLVWLLFGSLFVLLMMFIANRIVLYFDPTRCLDAPLSWSF